MALKWKQYETPIKYSRGNRKIGYDTLIINITSAHDCMALAQNNPALNGVSLCQVPVGTCYAWRSENLYVDHIDKKTGKLVTGCRKSREAQERIWDRLSAAEMAEQINQAVDKESGLTAPHPRGTSGQKIPITYIRFQESGDFRGQADVDKLLAITQLLKVPAYTYTARKDLDFSQPRSNLTINGSGFMLDNDFHVSATFPSHGGPRCRGIKGGGCYGCILCKTPRGRVIQELLQKGGGQKGTKETTTTSLIGDEHGGVEAGEAEMVGTAASAAEETVSLDEDIPGMTAPQEYTEKPARPPRKSKSSKSKHNDEYADSVLGSLSGITY